MNALHDDIEPVARFNGNGMTGWLQSKCRYDQAAERASRLALAADELNDEFVSAFSAGPYSNVSTPAFKPKRDSVVSVIQDSFSEADGEATLAALLNVMRAALKCKDPAVLLPAQAWLATFAKAHGERHASDFIEGSGE